MGYKSIIGAICTSVFMLFTATVHAVHLGGSTADKLNVPGDFPGSFHMDLLGIGTLTVEMPDINSPTGYSIFQEVAFDTQGTCIKGTSCIKGT